MPTNAALLTTPTDELTEGNWTTAWLIEFGLIGPVVYVFGKANVTRWIANGRSELESDETGGCYSESYVINGAVELHTVEDNTLAVFPTEEAMRAGARVIVDALGDQLPVGIHRALTAS